MKFLEENMEFWHGKTITKLEENEIFLYGSNPQGINGAGAAKAAMSLSKGAKNGIGRGFNGSNAYALVTKSLNAGFLEKSTGILYDKEGYRSVSPEQISANIDELYEVARQPEHQNKKFLVSYQYETWDNGSPKKSLNGYTCQEMLEMFVKDKDVPPNIIFHESYKPHLEKFYKNKISSKALSTSQPQSPSSNDNDSEDYTFFFHLTSPFSNFHPSIFEYKGLTFISNEQFMMYSKARTFNDVVSAQKILDMNNHPLAQRFLKGELSRENITNDNELSKQWNSLMMGVKKLGRGVKNYNEEVWNNRRVNVVLFGARLKFTQNEDLKQILLNTKNSQMIEASPYDKIWGIGLSETQAKKTPSEQWPGLNLLGKVLDTLKSELKADLQAVEGIKKESGIEVVNFYKVGKSIPEEGVYIGRANKNFGLSQSKFANPFPMKEQTEEERNRVVAEYRKWVWQEVSSGNITKEEILSLKDKKLVCYCSPKACHGDVLKSLVEYVLNNEAEFDDKIKNNDNKKFKI